MPLRKKSLAAAPPSKDQQQQEQKQLQQIPTNGSASPTSTRKGSIFSLRSRKDSLTPVTSREEQQYVNQTLADLHVQSRKLAASGYVIDTQTGERRLAAASMSAPSGRTMDQTEMMHMIARQTSEESLRARQEADPNRPPGEPDILSLGHKLWLNIASYLSLPDCASLALTSKTFLDFLGPGSWDQINKPYNKPDRAEFLLRLDESLPDHLLCFPCAQYHIRLHPGEEKLTTNHVTSPVFICPLSTRTRLERTRIASGRTLPFAYAQLAMRYARYGPLHGIRPEALGRRWSDNDSRWRHESRFLHLNDHLLFRCVSTTPAPIGITAAGERLLLFDRNEYAPYFSCCAHWRHGELIEVAKCALRHVPEAPESFSQQLRKGYSLSQSSRVRNFMPSQCGFCRDMRRCPECPSEYLVEIKVVESRTLLSPTQQVRRASEPGASPLPEFMHALVVTRWTDLGTAKSPRIEEWAAQNGHLDDLEDDDEAKYDSFQKMNKRTVSGAFEAEINNHLFLKRVVSMNPSGKKRTEENTSWY